MGIKLHIWGKRACFTRPELSTERMSYDVMTPSAARGALEAIFWKPEIEWHINRIATLKPIRWSQIKRQEARHHGSGKTARMDIAKDSVLRTTMFLRDVAYVIDAHIALTEKAKTNAENTIAKYLDQINRRITGGQCYRQPHLGLREFVADFGDASQAPPVDDALLGERDLGLMVHSLDYTKARKPRWFRAVMRDGVIDVPPLDSTEVLS